MYTCFVLGYWQSGPALGKRVVSIYILKPRIHLILLALSVNHEFWPLLIIYLQLKLVEADHPFNERYEDYTKEYKKTGHPGYYKIVSN